jgi:uncharacterized membrane protein
VGLRRRFAQGELRLTRVEAFSHGVFAIVVTLLVLDLTPLFFIVPPSGDGARD